MSTQLSSEQILDDYATYVSSGKANFFKSIGLPLIPGKREGVRIYDRAGHAFINCRSSGGVFNLGHRPQPIIEALKNALDELDIGDHLLLSEWRARLAKKLAALTPGDIRYATFTPGGGEAIDVAIKLARAYTGRPGVIHAVEAYHGHTGFALSATGDKFKARFGPMIPGFYAVPFGDIAALEDVVNATTAAVIFETIPVTGGILIPPPDYYPRVRALCDRFGAQMILDEVQAGLGRTGKLWALSEWNIVPDFMVLGKGLSAALYPISAATYRPHIDARFADEPFMHISSYGGAELGCVAAAAMLDIITAPGFLDNVNARAKQLGAGSAAIRARYPALVADVRQRGLMIGIEMVDDMLGPALTLALAQRGVLANYAGARANTLIIMPPLIIGAADTARVLNALEDSFRQLAGG
jgi:acetylornithine/succinyldiaminopimelate/putrescine aminotransferase